MLFLLATAIAVMGAGKALDPQPNGGARVAVHPDYAGGRQAVRLADLFGLQRGVRADTLTFEAPAGQVFIAVLPDSTDTGEIIDFANIRVPARSWRAGRAFFWQTVTDDVGLNHIEFLVRTTSAIDTLTLSVEIKQ